MDEVGIVELQVFRNDDRRFFVEIIRVRVSLDLFWQESAVYRIVGLRTHATERSWMAELGIRWYGRLPQTVILV